MQEFKDFRKFEGTHTL